MQSRVPLLSLLALTTLAAIGRAEASATDPADGGFVIGGVTAIPEGASADQASSRRSRFMYIRTAPCQPVDNAPPSDGSSPDDLRIPLPPLPACHSGRPQERESGDGG